MLILRNAIVRVIGSLEMRWRAAWLLIQIYTTAWFRQNKENALS